MVKTLLKVTGRGLRGLADVVEQFSQKRQMEQTILSWQEGCRIELVWLFLIILNKPDFKISKMPFEKLLIAADIFRQSVSEYMTLIKMKMSSLCFQFLPIECIHNTTRILCPTISVLCLFRTWSTMLLLKLFLNQPAYQEKIFLDSRI